MHTIETSNDEATQNDSGPDRIAQQCATIRLQLFPPRCIRDSVHPELIYDWDETVPTPGAGCELLVDLVKAGMKYVHAVLYTFIAVYYTEPYLKNEVYPSHIASVLNRSPQSVRRQLKQMTALGFFASRRHPYIKFLRYEDLIAQLEKHRQER